MNALIAAAVHHSRTVLLFLALILIAGTIAYRDIPKEADPDVAIPIIYVSMSHEGISPEDADRLLVRPMSKELQSIEGVKQMTSAARRGQASVTLEFEAGFDSEKAMRDVREKVDKAQAELPAETEEPTVNEVNVALFPILVVSLSGEVPERTLVRLARDLRDKLERLPGVLEVKIAGDREEVVEVIVDPLLLENYGISLDEVGMTVMRNHKLVAAGVLDSGHGRFSVKVPGLIEKLPDILNMPIKAAGDRVVTVGDIAQVRRTFKDPEGYARMDGRPTIALEVVKRVGRHILITVADVKRIVAEEQALWPDNVQVSFSQDKSRMVRNLLSDLENNILSSIILVMIVVVAALGLRTAGLVGVSLPGSFLLGILAIAAMGLTMNMVVLFSLILAAGMLIDGAIVVTEFADRKMAEGSPKEEAYLLAAQRMAWPIISSTATTLAVFMPLLFWPGVVGEFMKYLPITLIATLSASLLMALIFVPTLGGVVGKRPEQSPRQVLSLAAAESGNLNEITGFTGWYVRVLQRLLPHPLKVLLAAVFILVGSFMLYGTFGLGVEFFPAVEPEQAALHVRARGNLSHLERDRLVRGVEERILGLPEIDNLYVRSGTDFQQAPADTVGVIQFEFIDWKIRRKAALILAEMRQRTQDLPGIVIEDRPEENGPAGGKPVQLELTSRDPERLPPAVMQVRAAMEEIGGFVDVEDTLPIPGVEWQVTVDRSQAGRFGVDVTAVGDIIQLVTSGRKMTDFRPEGADDEVDIRLRLLPGFRTLDQMDRLRVKSSQGLVPITNFITQTPAPKVGTVERSNRRLVRKVSAEVADGLLVDKQVTLLKARLAVDPQVEVVFKGEDEEQQEAQRFLSRAFLVALFMMAIILVTQFNSFYQALLILSAVIFSTVGVFLGLLITHEPFGIVMSGIGVISLAGIVVNNNIVLIDTFNVLHKGGMPPLEAVLRTGAQRLRPVLLTTVTTILGLIPMVMGLNIDLINREISQGGPSTQWWTQLATAIAGGLTFATLLTLILTPCLLVLGKRGVRKK